jgi:CDP-diacylglycerol--glycerol-3-phosphate 3-phosphatidyltransferase
MAKIFQVSARAGMTRVVEPIARALLRAGVTPNAVTVAGTVGVLVGALGFGARGHLVAGALIVTLFALTDLLDGTMARMTGTTSKWGAFLDSTLDRLGDAAIFGGLVLYFAGPGESLPLASLALYCLVMGSVTSYARARAESLGMEARGGIAERADRLVAILVMTGLSAIFDVPVLIPLTLAALALASTVTVVQRVLAVRSQAKAAA